MEKLDPRRSWPGFLIAAGVCLTITFTLLRPEITKELSASARLAFWTLHVFIPLILLQFSQIVLSNQIIADRVSPWIQILAAGFLGALLMTPIADALDTVFDEPFDGSDQFQSLAQRWFDEFTGLAPIVILVWLALNATRLVRLDPPRVSTPAAAPDFWGRVPTALGNDLIALSAELHYLRVYTAQGNALILWSFGTAIADLPAEDGLQIHRSHWVSLRHVKDVQKRGQAALCRLSNGLSLPVSRKRKSALTTAIDQ